MQMNDESFTGLLGNYSVVAIVAMFLLFAVAEMIIPLQKFRGRLSFRWFTNIMLTVCTLAIFKLAAPVFAILAAGMVTYLDIGLFNNLEVSLPLTLLLGILIFDFKQYWFHRLVHAVDNLWLIHRVHHSDLEVDLTTGFRFHPVESILSGLLDVVLIALFGIPAEVILLRYVLIFFVNFFTHGNILIPSRLDHYLKWILVTPSMHHLHHALNRRAANSNFGVVFSFWDRIFKTFMSEHPGSAKGEGRDRFTYGIPGYREPDRLSFGMLLLMPFKSTTKVLEDRTTDD